MHSARAITTANLALIASWFWVHEAALRWGVQSLTRPDSELNLVLAVALSGLGLWHADFRAIAHRLTQLPQWNLSAAALLLFGAVSVSADWIALQAAHAFFSGVGAYGLAGLYLPRATWVRARPVAALAIALMPLAAYLDVYLGFPARRFTAEAVAGMLTALDIPNMTSGVVLSLEGGAAYVDLPCAGVRSLWTGAVFLLGAATLEGLTIDLRFLVTALVSTLLLLITNTARVASIVLLDFVADLPLLAEVLHAPMGVLGFVLCCAAAWAMLTVGKAHAHTKAHAHGSTDSPLIFILAPALFLLGLQSAPESVAAVSSTPQSAPPGFDVLVLNQAERDFASEQGGQIVKVRFERGGLSGTVVLVTSTSWLAQHLPRHCLQASGVSLTGEAPTPIDGAPVRWAHVVNHGRPGRAAWWFQSNDHLTDDHTERIWAGLNNDQPWTLVSILLEQGVDPDHPEVVALVADLRDHLQSAPESP